MNKGRKFDAIEPGDSHEQEYTVTEKMIEAFAEATGDRNPVHFDEQFAEESIFKARVAHGMLSAGFISAVLGTSFPGPGTVYISQTLQFRKPVYIGDRILVRVAAAEKLGEKNRIRLDTLCLNQHGDPVLSGEAVVMPPE